MFFVEIRRGYELLVGIFLPHTSRLLKIISFPSLQKQAMLVRQLEEELRHQKARGLSVEVQSQLENLSTENDHLNREVAILRETIKVSCCTLPVFFTFPFSLASSGMKKGVDHSKHNDSGNIFTNA